MRAPSEIIKKVGKTMRTAEELILDAKTALAEDDIWKVSDILCEALGHLSDFSWRTGVTWEWSEVKECCHEIGELLYDHGGMTLMKDIYMDVRDEMKYVAARYLEHSWNGCGDGAWRS